MVAGQNKLPLQTPNSNAPLCIITEDVNGALKDSQGKAVTGKLELYGYVTSAWRYLFGTFAQKTTAIDPNFKLTAGVGYSQTQMQALINQVELLSKQLGQAT